MKWPWRKRYDELDEEIRAHIEMSAHEREERGELAEEARAAARREFGNVGLVKETTRDSWGYVWIERLWQDVRYAVRLLRKTPLITTIAFLSLALGIGANTAIFSLIDAVMLRMLPVQNPEQLARITFRSPTSPRPRQNVTNPIWEQVRDHQDAFSDVIAWSPQTFDLADGGEVTNINGIYASGDYFTVLRVRPAAGRLIAASDDVRGCSGVAVLGYGFWQSHYAGAESAMGSLIRLNGHRFRLSAWRSRFSSARTSAKSWTWRYRSAQKRFWPARIPRSMCATIGGSSMMGRLKPGITVEQADAHMKVFRRRSSVQWCRKIGLQSTRDRFRKYKFAVLPGATGTGGIGLREQYSQPLKILMFVVGLVLLIACANIASLLLARSAARTEGDCCASVARSFARPPDSPGPHRKHRRSPARARFSAFSSRGGAARLLVRFVSTQQNQVFLDLKMDGRVLAFTIAIAVLCGLLFGILPALRSTRVDAISAMKEGQSQTAGGRAALLRRALDRRRSSRALAHSRRQHRPVRPHLRESHDSRRRLRP